MIIMLKFMEPRAEVKLVQNVHYKIKQRHSPCKEVLQPTPVYSVRLRRHLPETKTAAQFVICLRHPVISSV